jgi:hypothetical protein
VRSDYARHDTVRSSASAARWQKLGTLERLVRYHGGPHGTPSPGEKLIAGYLIHRASTADAEPRVFVAAETIHAELGMSPKTFRAYVKDLVRRGWITEARDRAYGAKTWYIGPLVAFFSEDQIGKDSPSKITELRPQIGKESPSDNEHRALSDGEILPSRSGNSGDQIGKVSRADGEILPFSLDHVPDHIRPHTEHTALARRLGLEPSWFQNRPRRFAAAHLVVARLDAWGMTQRRIRDVARDYGFTAVAGAVGYVLEQLDRSEQPALVGDAVQIPAALFETALQREWSGTLPGFADDAFSPTDGGWSVEVDLWETLRDMLRHRVPRLTFEVAFKLAKLRRTKAGFAVVIPTPYGLTAGRGALPVVRTCLERIGFGGIPVSLVTEAGS